MAEEDIELGKRTLQEFSTRRTFLKRGVRLAGGAVAAGLLAGCSPFTGRKEGPVSSPTPVGKTPGTEGLGPSAPKIPEGAQVYSVKDFQNLFDTRLNVYKERWGSAAQNEDLQKLYRLSEGKILSPDAFVTNYSQIGGEKGHVGTQRSVILGSQDKRLSIILVGGIQGNVYPTSRDYMSVLMLDRATNEVLEIQFIDDPNIHLRTAERSVDQQQIDFWDTGAAVDYFIPGKTTIQDSELQKLVQALPSATVDEKLEKKSHDYLERVWNHLPQSNAPKH